MRAVIFANGQLNRPIDLQPDDLVIAADGGTHHCLGLGIRPQVVIGDLDSVREDELEALTACGTEIITYPERKDFSDLELALQEAQKRGAARVIILAALGARWDQSLANILLPAAMPGLSISLVDAQQEIYFIRPGGTLEITGLPGDAVSLIPLGGDANGITTQGLEYPLYQERLRFGSTRGISNVMLGNHASVKLGDGFVACSVYHRAEE